VTIPLLRHHLYDARNEENKPSHGGVRTRDAQRLVRYGIPAGATICRQFSKLGRGGLYVTNFVHV
jgi:hypothetical protein